MPYDPGTGRFLPYGRASPMMGLASPTPAMGFPMDPRRRVGLTPELIRLLTGVINAEVPQSHGEPGRRAVAGVALNRLNANRFGPDLTSILTAPSQFAKPAATNPAQEAQTAALLEQYNADQFTSPAGGALYFRNDDAVRNRPGMDARDWGVPFAKIGPPGMQHSFYGTHPDDSMMRPAFAPSAQDPTQRAERNVVRVTPEAPYPPVQEMAASEKPGGFNWGKDNDFWGYLAQLGAGLASAQPGEGFLSAAGRGMAQGRSARFDPRRSGEPNWLAGLLPLGVPMLPSEQVMDFYAARRRAD